MEPRINRRDFLNGGAVGIGALGHASFRDLPSDFKAHFPRVAIARFNAPELRGLFSLTLAVAFSSLAQL